MEKILVVDNDPYTLKLFERLFCKGVGEQKIDITRITSGNEAKRRFLEQTYNLILMDQHLPDAKGLDLLQWMIQEGSQQVAILMTGLAHSKAVLEALSKGLFAVLSKPFKNLETLEAVIEKGLELDRAYREIKRLRDTLETGNNEVTSKESEKVSSYQEEMNIFESSYLKRLLKISDGNIAEAARLSGMSPEELSLRLKHCNLS